MDLALNQVQGMLRRTAREFLEANCTTTSVREVEASGEGYSAELWEQMAGLGWMGLAVPAEYGGEGGDAVDQLVLAEEMGRALLPSPYMTSAVTCGRLLELAGAASQRAEMLPLLAQGKLIMSLALDDDSEECPTKVSAQGSGIRISGTKIFVPFANAADMLIVVGDGPEYGGVTLGLIPTDAEGVTIESQESIAGFPQARVEFKDVAIDPSAVLGVGGEAKAALGNTLEWATLMRCGEMVGRGRKILEMVIDYAKNRVQFGRPIGAFQAIQHQLADLRVAVDIAELMAYRAASGMDEGRDCSEDIALAKASADEMSRMSTVVGHGVYAGISYTVEHDMQLYSARNRLAEADGGGMPRQIDRIASCMGL